jgi:hypothetical protein
MGADASPYARLQRALAAGLLQQAESAARELRHLSLDNALALVLLMLRERDARFERAAVKWLGRVLSERPQLGLELARELADALAALPNSRSWLAGLLDHAGLPRSAELLTGRRPANP